MEMTNYICINGKKTELTEEQLKKLGIELPKANPFKRAKHEDYYAINSQGKLERITETFTRYDNNLFDIANYCTDKSIIEQRALHETLNRLLWRFSMTHKAKGEVLHEIYYDRLAKKWSCMSVSETYCYFGSPRFDSYEIAQKAIEEIVKPFMKAHPEFKL